MSAASNSNPRSLRNHSEAQACSDSSTAKLNDCAPAVRAAYEAAMNGGAPANDNRPEDVTCSDAHGGTGPAEAFARTQVIDNNVALLSTPKKLNRNGPPEQYEPPRDNVAAQSNEQYLDRSADPETLSIPLVSVPKLNRVIPQSETDLRWLVGIY